MSQNSVQQEEYRWFYRLRTSEIAQYLVSQVDEFDVEISELYDEEVRLPEEENGRVFVFLRLQKGQNKNYIVCGEFIQQEDTYELDDVYIEVSDIYGRLAGKGVRWKIEDGQIVEKEWIA